VHRWSHRVPDYQGMQDGFLNITTRPTVVKSIRLPRGSTNETTLFYTQRYSHEIEILR
jgi:hypothetical protein